MPIEPCPNLKGFYICPSLNPGKGYCNSPGHYYCVYWGCETIAADWSPGAGPDKFLKVGWVPWGCDPPEKDSYGGIQLSPRHGIPPGKVNCKFIYVNISKPMDPGWIAGKTWGMRFWKSGTTRDGLFLIKKEVITPEPQALGPNPVISYLRDPEVPHITEAPVLNITDKTKLNPSPNIKDDPLWKLLNTTYQVLNSTNPNLIQHCWLCYDVKPPFYESVGVLLKIRRINGSNPSQCLWREKKQGITMQYVSGKGRCIGNVPPSKQHLCGIITSLKEKPPADWLVPDSDTEWICSKTGVTPCLSLKLFNENEEYCIQVIIIPRIIYQKIFLKISCMIT